jgi:hypothetical protein
MYSTHNYVIKFINTTDVRWRHDIHLFLGFCVVLLCVFTFCIPCCDVSYDFRIKTMFGSFLPPVVCRMAESYFRYLCLFTHSGVQHILCCVFALFVNRRQSHSTFTNISTHRLACVMSNPVTLWLFYSSIKLIYDFSVSRVID